MNENDESLKMDSSAEEYNKQLLKQTAFTFSREGISNDLKYFIQKKVSHNKTNLSYLTQLYGILVSSESEKMIEMASSKNSSLRRLLEHVTSEIIQTDLLLDKSIDFVLKKDKTIQDLKGE